MERPAELRAPVPLPVNVDTTGAKIMEDGSSRPDQRDSRDIYLPNHIESVSHIAVDVGGSLAKVVYFTRSRSQPDADRKAGGSKSPNSASRSTNSGSHVRDSSRNGHVEDIQPSTSSPSSSSSAVSSSIAQNLHAGRSEAEHFSSSSHPTPSGTLTPTAILSEHHSQHPPHIGSAVNAMRSSLLKRRSLPAALPGGRLNFMKFETADIESCISFLQELISSSAKANGVTITEMRRGVKLMATGGGAHLFYERFEEALGVEVQREDEMGCLITGLNFITLIPDEVFWFSDELVSALHSPLPPNSGKRGDPVSGMVPSVEPPQRSQAEALPRPSPNPPLYAPMFDSNPSPKLPCLLVNIGSGVSMIKVDDFGKFERVSGTSLGGGTLWGLLSLLTQADSFDEMLELSEKGDNGAVDLLVSDVYGNSNALNAFGLKSSTIASSFGKVFRKENKPGPGESKERRKRFRPEDICRSLLYAVSNNIGQIAHMTAEKYDLDRIYFGGCFIRGHQATISTLSYAIRFWSKGTKRAFFLRHEGYLGAIGAWIKHLDDPLQMLDDKGLSRQSSRNDLSRQAAADHANNPANTTNATVPIHSAEQESQKSVNGDQGSQSTTSPPGSSNFQPARSMETSGLLPTPITEAPEPQLVTPTAAAPPEAAPTQAPIGESMRSLSINGESASQTEQEGRDLLSMLNDLQDSHRAIVEPVVQSNGIPATPRAREEEEEELESILTAAESGDEDSASVVELLRKLEQAEGAADGLETKLDSLLGRLDGMLGSGEPGTNVGR